MICCFLSECKSVACLLFGFGVSFLAVWIRVQSEMSFLCSAEIDHTSDDLLSDCHT